MQGPEHAAYIKACVANGNEVQKEEACWQVAAEARSGVLQLLNEAERSIQEICSICLEELCVTEPTKPDARLVILLPCMHCFHLECAGRWRLNSRSCPLCQNDLHTLDQMLFAGKHIHGQDSQFGRLCEPLKEPHHPKHGSQSEGIRHTVVDQELALQLMNLLRNQMLPGMDLSTLEQHVGSFLAASEPEPTGADPELEAVPEPEPEPEAQ